MTPAKETTAPFLWLHTLVDHFHVFISSRQAHNLLSCLQTGALQSSSKDSTQPVKKTVGRHKILTAVRCSGQITVSQRRHEPQLYFFASEFFILLTALKYVFSQRRHGPLWRKIHPSQVSFAWNQPFHDPECLCVRSFTQQERLLSAWTCRMSDYDLSLQLGKSGQVPMEQHGWRSTKTILQRATLSSSGSGIIRLRPKMC